MYKLKRWRLQPLIFVVLFVFATLVTTVNSTSTASAETRGLPGLLYNDDLYKKLSAHQHYWWLVSCFNRFDVDTITKSEMGNWDFFQGKGGDANLGDMYDDFGERSCENEGVVETAFGYLGETSPQQAFCKLRQPSNGAFYTVGGERYRDFDSCVTGAGNGTWDMEGNEGQQSGTFRDEYSAKDPGMSGAAEYMRSYSSLMQGCDVKLGSEVYDSAGAVPDTGADNKYAVAVVIDTGDGKTFDVKYRQGIGIGGGSQRALVSNTNRNESGTAWRSCNQLAELALENAEAYARYLGANGYDKTATTDPGTDTNNDPVCSAGALGWIICPLAEGMVNLTEFAAGEVEKLLIFKPLITAEPDSQGAVIRTIWGVVLGIANALLIIGFLVVVFSQATSIGLSSYGIKKILPRIIAAAIFMNLSFFVCALAVDISNVVGASVKEIIQTGMNTLPPPGDGLQRGADWSQNITAILGGGAILVGAAATGAIWLIAPYVMMAAVAVFTALLVLAARQVLIVLLIIMAPIAIAAWMLPNTDEWFTRWRKLFVALLVMYPIIMAIFYGSVLVANIIMITGE